MKKVYRTKEEVTKIWDFYYEFSKNPILNGVYGTPQHRTSNTYRHVCLVTRLCVFHVLRKRLDYDIKSLIRGAFLHDLFYYDWRKDKSKKWGHLTNHPMIALENAQKEFELTDIEIDIIKNHMWPITITRFPHTKEGRLVMRMDKKATILEVFNRKRNILVFDLDGTLVYTLPDLNGSINYMCEQMGYPTLSIEHTRKAVGNGVPVLVRRSIPEGTSEEDYQKALKIFKEHYIEHAIDKSTPYEGMYDVLRRLRKRGYTLTVVTNKNEDMARKILDHFYPHMFAEIVGANGVLKPKPHFDMMNELRNRIGLKKRSRAVYIGDTEVDYQTAKNALIPCYIVTYGYRTPEELEKLHLKAHFINKPEDLLNSFIKKGI